MRKKPRILFVGAPAVAAGEDLAGLDDRLDLVRAADGAAWGLLNDEEFDGLIVAAENSKFELRRLAQGARILEALPEGAALVDEENSILWANRRMREWVGRDDIQGLNFYAALNRPEIDGPATFPLHMALQGGRSSEARLRTPDGKHFQLHVEPAAGPGEPPLAVVTIRDVTADVQQQQKVAAIHQAGLELANLSPEDLTQMSVDSRIDLLKSNILHYTRQLLNFDVVEIRLLDAQTGRLEPLLSSGMTDEAAGRVLYAQPESNGVTGHVAYTGKSYLCEDTSRDPLYIEGVRGAKSSITVPLKLQDQTIGTFNVESPDAEGLTDLDLMFLEIFARDVAVALNTLELLVAERAATAAKNVEAIHGAVAMPVDEILNDAVHLMEAFIGKQPEMDERLRHILRNARDIKQLIQREGQKMAPVLAQPVGASGERRSLRGKLVLVVDSEESVRQAAHRLLERQGCTVETAHSGIEALAMIRQMTPGMSYDAVLADKRLPDMDGCELMRGVRVLRPETPLLLMTGFGYDPGHVLVRARELGLAGVLYKPFKTDKLLDTVEQAMAGPPTACPPTAN